jgi:hypothetical protein
MRPVRNRNISPRIRIPAIGDRIKLRIWEDYYYVSQISEDREFLRFDVHPELSYRTNLSWIFLGTTI